MLLFFLLATFIIVLSFSANTPYMHGIALIELHGHNDHVGGSIFQANDTCPGHSRARFIALPTQLYSAAEYL